MKAARNEGCEEPAFPEKSYISVVANLLKKLDCKMQIEKSSFAWLRVFTLHFSVVNFQFFKVTLKQTYQTRVTLKR